MVRNERSPLGDLTEHNIMNLDLRRRLEFLSRRDDYAYSYATTPLLEDIMVFVDGNVMKLCST